MSDKRSVLAIIMNKVTGKGELLTRILEGDVLNNTVNALAAAVFKDHEGNAIFPTLNPDGTLPVSSDAGKPFASSEVFEVVSQTKDTEAKACSVALDVDADEALTYTRPDFKITSYAEHRVRLELIVDEGLGGEAITVLGYGATADAFINDKQRIVNNFATVPAAATTAELRLMAIPYEDGNQADDLDCSISINKLPPQTP